MSEYEEYSKRVGATESSSSERVKFVNQIFGLAPNGELVTILGSTQVPSSNITFVTGTSGAGKTTLLNLIHQRKPEARCLPVSVPEDAPVIDLFKAEVPECIRWLGKFGLGEARLMTTPYKYLSEGQKLRMKLALLMWEKPSCVIIDEFLSLLDRQTARIVAFNFQKLCREFNISAYIASSHNDLIAPIGPDHVIELDLNGSSVTMRSQSHSIPQLPELEEIEVSAGTPNDYLSQARFHYIEHLASEASLSEDDWEHSISQIRIAKLRGRVIGVLLCSSPVPRLLNKFPFFRLINESAIVILRVIIHPTFRGVGLTKILQPELSDTTQCVVTCSALGLYFPFFLGAGFEPIEHPRNLRYPEHTHLENLLADLRVSNLAPLNKYEHAQEFLVTLKPKSLTKLRALVSSIIIKSNVDYCLFFQDLLGIPGERLETKEALEEIFSKLVQAVPPEEFGILLSESLYFPVQGFIRRIDSRH
jgi:ABC-type lipoprotein export system ATPase subunit